MFKDRNEFETEYLSHINKKSISTTQKDLFTYYINKDFLNREWFSHKVIAGLVLRRNVTFRRTKVHIFDSHRADSSVGNDRDI